jgi:hypothetical protein
MAKLHLMDCLDKTEAIPKELKRAIIRSAVSRIQQGEDPISAQRSAVESHLKLVQQDLVTAEVAWKETKAIESEGRETSGGPEIRAFANPEAIKGAAAAGKFAAEVKEFVSVLPKDTDFRRAVMEYVGREQENSFEVMKASKEITANAPDPIGRAGITNYIQAAGDKVLLAKRAYDSKNLEIKKGYKAALNLTKDELGVVKKVTGTYADLRDRAIAYGINLGEVQNYVNQIWDLQVGSERGIPSPRRMSDYFRFSKPRTFQNYFEGEQAGYKSKTKDIGALFPIYINELNRAINARVFVEHLSKGVASDGRPLVTPFGGPKVIAKDEGGNVYLIFPHMPSEATKDYKVLGNHPALRAWKWMGKDTDGNPIFLQSDLAVHPEIYKHLSNIFGTSLLRDWWNTTTDNPFSNVFKGITKFLLDDLQQGAKQTMFDASPFHAVQEGTHAVGHQVYPLKDIPEINLKDPEQIDWVRHELMLYPDRLSQQYFMEGVGSDSKSWLRKLSRKVGASAFADMLDWQSDWLFHRYIPGLKLKTVRHIYERNTKRYAPELKAGTVNIDQIKILSAQQTNAAYGHQNYALLGPNGRNPTLQHILQVAFLAPDFFEARARFTGQAAKGIFSKTGVEQLNAFLLLGAVLTTIAQLTNMLLNGEPDWEHPFEIKYRNRYYGLRSVPGDFLHAMKDALVMLGLKQDKLSFIQGRLSPIVGKGLMQGLFQINWRGEKVDSFDTFKDIVFGTVPMPLQFLTRQFTSTGKATPISPLEQMAGALGIHIHRYSPITEMYPLAKQWQKENYPNTLEKGTYPISKYTQLRYALEDGDKEAVVAEFKKLRDTGMTAEKIATGFRESTQMPFTDNLFHDKQFYRSLSEYDKLKFDAAIKRRAVLLDRLNQWLPVLKKPISQGDMLNRILSAQEKK